MNTRVYLLRHGEPVLQNALLGSTDSPLSETGWRQLEETIKAIPQLDSLVASPLSRCANFAQALAADRDLPLSINSEWRECHFGDWDGQTYASLHQQYPQATSEFFSDPHQNPPPGGESLISFSLRVENALGDLLENYRGQQVAVITHAGVIRTLVAWCLKMRYETGLQFRRFAIDYASLTEVSVFHDDKDYPQLIRLNQRFTTQESGSNE